MGTAAIAECDEHPSVIAGRYQVERVLGRGGMAVVYQVRDTRTGKTLALKQLLPEEDGQAGEETAHLFEQEFYTLAQLAHPGVIEVYDFGKDDTRPYYTMERLEGGELRDLAPLPWNKACSLLMDVCSAVSLLHSRRQVHRDVSPRNIHCGRNGGAKLIDFGAMIPVGPCRRVIGTPAYAAPEAVGLQTLEIQSDLYSLGATLYYALTRRNAYPAKSFSELRRLWTSQPVPPSQHVADIPKELDELVLSLIDLDPMARPSNAAEVMEKLSAIAGLELDERLLVSQAYLSTPTLVGRDQALRRFKKRLLQAIEGRGHAILIRGTSGAGRSRFLDTCMLEARIHGAAILKADASDALGGSWSVVRAIAAQLLDALPALALAKAEPHLAVLGHVLPELVSRFEAARSGALPLEALTGQPLSAWSQKPKRLSWVGPRGSGFPSKRPGPALPSSIPLCNSDNAQELRQRVQAALLDWLLQVGSEHLLMLAIDDVHRIDEPSAALVALLSREIPRKPILIAATTDPEAPSGSAAVMKLLEESSATIKLRSLGSEQTEGLLGSIFGRTAHLQLLADKIQTISGGNPRAVMQLAQHLADNGTIVYQAGAWLLPAAISAGDLPESFADALRARTRRLGADALRLAQTMASSPEQSFSHDECLLLTEHRQMDRLVQILDELVAMEVVSTDGEQVWLTQPGWTPVLVQDMDEQARRACHQRVAEVLEKRGNDPFRAAQHWLRAGQEDRALDAFVSFSQTSAELTAKDPSAYSELLQSLPDDWQCTFGATIDLARQRGRPRGQVFALQSRLTSLAAIPGTVELARLMQVLEQLVHDSGLGFYRELGDSVEPNERLRRSLELAQQRYDTSPDSERVLPPADAIRALSRNLAQSAGVVYAALDASFRDALPSLEPLIQLSPALGVVHKQVQAAVAGTKGLVESTRQLNREIVERLDQPDGAGLNLTHHQFMRYGAAYSLGLIEAVMGLPSALKWASQLESLPLFSLNVELSRMLHHLWQGNASEAEACRRRAELLQIQGGSYLAWGSAIQYIELLAHCLSDDLLGVKRILGSMEDVAEKYPGWVPTLRYARGEYQRIRGDNESALQELQQALEQTAPGQYRGWANIAGAYVKTLYALRRYEEARTEGRELLKAAEEQNLGYLCHYVGMPLALSEARLGDFDNAVRISEAAIHNFKALGTTGLNLGLAYETRADVAIQMNDPDTFHTNAELCAAEYKVGDNRALSAKHARLMDRARRRRLGAHGALLESVDSMDLSSAMTLGELTGVLHKRDGHRDRAERALELLVKTSHASGGFLYLWQHQGPVLAAENGGFPCPTEMHEVAQKYLLNEIDGSKDVTVTSREQPTSTTGANQWAFGREQQYHPVLLGHPLPEGFAIAGVAVLLVDPTQPFVFPAELAAAVSGVFLDAGDVPLVCAAT